MIITPKTKVGELLDCYPELESVLIEMSPSFEKLKNPILRRTVARVATIQQIAAVGGLSADTIVSRLREATEQTSSEEESGETQYLSAIAPEWFTEKRIVKSLNASPIINSGGSPMNEILRQTNLLNPGEIFELKTPFIPAPIIDMLKEKKFRIHCIQDKNEVTCYINKS